MPRARTAVEAIEREMVLLIERRTRAQERDTRFTAKVNELTLVMRQNQALIDDINKRLDLLDHARDELTPVPTPEEIFPDEPEH
jgi:hypothetical protein